ncbi:MAG TPA: ribonuclease E inhibitor RraB [Acidobacteriaceae bacterium]|nr:ribonuclease E inhibitor RraB [Acidobacteriaceae bacterium]
MFLPNDDNGDALRRLLAEGDDLSLPRNVDFTVVFPDQASAEGFARDLEELGYRVAVKLTECKQEFPWDVVVAKRMQPSHQEIEEFESLLQKTADVWGGHNDGWGCFTHPRQQ